MMHFIPPFKKFKIHSYFLKDNSEKVKPKCLHLPAIIATNKWHFDELKEKY